MRLPTERRKTHNIVENGTSSDTFYPVLGCSFVALNRLGYSIVFGSTEAQFTMTQSQCRMQMAPASSVAITVLKCARTCIRLRQSSSPW